MADEYLTTRPLLPPGGEWTVDDLELLPDDGLQYELFDGILVVSPVPVPLHQSVVGALFLLLRPACPPDMRAFVGPVDFQPDRFNSAQPDVFVVRRADIGARNIIRPLVLAVEVLSPRTRRKDTLLKRSLYEVSGVEHYWVVDPEVPAFTAYERRRGRYVPVVRAKGTERVELLNPFPVTICPANLLAY